MNAIKFLIDTNIFVKLEDGKEVPPDYAVLQALCNKHGVRIYVHEDAIKDIQRDPDEARRKISLSKVEKFQRLKGIHLPDTAKLTQQFGAMNKVNDTIDVAQLYALDFGAIDYFITQDNGIHKRAKRCSLSNRVFYVTDALSWLRSSYEPETVFLPLIEEVGAHTLPRDDDIFDELPNWYPGFDSWWKKCIHQHRDCWKVMIEDKIAALVVRKDEDDDSNLKYTGDKILKICLFKVKEGFRGEKLGELLLKQILWFAQRNSYDLVFVTAFEHHTILIDLLNDYGFEKTGQTDLGDSIYEKPIYRTKLEASENEDLFTLVRRNYPRFIARSPVKSFIIPIKNKYHDILFPELAPATLFNPTGGGLISNETRTSGNTIRKVYICRSNITLLESGSVIVFYQSKTKDREDCQCVSTVGVVERTNYAESIEQLIRLVGKRSVYSVKQLEEIVQSRGERKVLVIDFLLIGHIEPPILLKEMIEKNVIKNHPQSIVQLNDASFSPVRQKMNFGFEV